MRRKVLIVDDHEDFRRSATALLAAEGFDVVGTVADGSAVVEAVERLRPEVVLLDIQLPDLDGFAVAERLAQTSDPPHVVLISRRGWRICMQSSKPPVRRARSFWRRMRVARWPPCTPPPIRSGRAR
jgi:DNA-binding NarL/FixJ family response regulator